MKIGIPKELKNNESRVGMTPAGVYDLTARGHEVYVQQSAGEKSGFPDESYRKAGAKVLPTIEEVYAIAEMIVKGQLLRNIRSYGRGKWSSLTFILPANVNSPKPCCAAVRFALPMRRCKRPTIPYHF